MTIIRTTKHGKIDDTNLHRIPPQTGPPVLANRSKNTHDRPPRARDRPVKTISIAMLAVVGIVFASLQVPTVIADTVTFVENFDDEETLSAPDGTGEGYTFSTSGANTFVSNVQSDTPSNSLRYIGTAASNDATFAYSQGTFCTGQYSFSVYMATLPAAGDTDKIGTTNAYIEIVSSGAFVLVVIGTGGQGSASPGTMTMPTGQWVDFAIRDDTPGTTTCSNPTFKSNVAQFSTQVAYPGGGPSSITQFKYIQNGISGTENRDVYIDNLVFDTGLSPATPFDVSLAVTGLTGFDIDSTGTLGIMRVDNGDTVQTFGPSNLLVVAAQNTDCNRSDGIAAIEKSVSYIQCDAGNSDRPSFLRVRGPDLNAPQFPEHCIDACQIDFEFDDQNDCTTEGIACNIGEITDMSLYRWDYSTKIERGETFLGEDKDAVVLEWGFSTSKGRVGIIGFIKANNEVGSRGYDEDSVLFDPTATPQVNQLCRSTNDGETEAHTTSVDVLGAATLNGGTKFYQVTTVLTIPEDSLTLTDIDVSISQSPVFSNTGDLGTANAIDCQQKGSLAVVQNANGVWVFNRTTGETILHKDTAGSEDGKSVHISEKIPVGPNKGRSFIAYKDGAFVKLMSDNGTEVTQLAVPAGTFVKVDMDSFAQKAWIATSDNVQVFKISSKTTIVSVSTTNPPPGTTTPPPTGELPGFGGAPAWVNPTILTIFIFEILPILVSIATRKFLAAFHAVAIALAGLGSIFWWGMPAWIPIVFLVLPCLAIIIWKGPWSNSGE